MKLRVRCYETKETQKLEVAGTCTLHDLRRRINASSPSSIHLSLNRKDEILASSPEDTLRSLGVASGDLIYYSVEPSAFVASPQEAEFAASVEAQRTLIQGALAKLGGRQALVQELDGNQAIESSLRGARYGELDIVPENPNANMNIPNQTNTDMNFRAEQQIEGSTGAISGMEESVLMDVENGDAVFADGRRLSETFFLKKVLMEESGDTSELTLLIVAVHAVMLESGFSRLDHGSGMHAEKFSFSKELQSIPFRYTLPELTNRGDPSTNDFLSLKFQSLGRMVIVYGSLGERSSVYRVSLDKRRFVPAIDLVMDTLKSDKEGCLSMYSEVFEFWKIVKDGLAMPLLIGLCDNTGLELPACLMRLPTELKLKILESLPGVDIARMACLCSEMRYVASNNDLWKQKCLEEFRSFVAGAKDVASWKAKFATCWETQKRKNQRLPRQIRLAFSQFLPIWRGPFPAGFPSISWYDRNHLPLGCPSPIRQRAGQLRQ